jgi:hypothetical protein
MADDIESRNEALRKLNQKNQAVTDRLLKEQLRLSDEAEKNPTPENIRAFENSQRALENQNRKASDDGRALAQSFDRESATGNSTSTSFSQDEQAQLDRLSQQSKDIYLKKKSTAQVAQENGNVLKEQQKKDMEKFMSENDVKITPVKKGGGDYYKVESTSTETVTGGGSTTITIPQPSAEWQQGQEAANQKEAENRAAAYAAYKEAHPELKFPKVASAFNREVLEGTVSYDKPGQEYSKTRPPANPIVTTTPGENKTTTAAEVVESDKPIVEKAPRDVNVSGRSLERTNELKDRKLESQVKMSELKEQKNQLDEKANAKDQEATDKLNASEEKRQEENTARRDAERYNRLADEAEANGDPAAAAQYRNQASESADIATQRSEEAAALDQEAQAAYTEASDARSQSETIDNDIINEEIEGQAIENDLENEEDALDDDEADRIANEANSDVDQDASQDFPLSQQDADNEASYGDSVEDKKRGLFAPKTTDVIDNQVKKTEIVTQPNVLHQFASYTYGLAWHMLSKTDYNRMATDPEGADPWRPSHTIIASAGKRGPQGSGFERDESFQEDFYIDNFKMDTIVGLNAGSRGSNAIDFSFTLIEPYGMTLVDRLMQAAVRIEAYNYMQVPYLLQIDFYGYRDDGSMVNLLEHRKYIPMRLTECKIKVSSRGAEYAVRGVPYHHQGFTDSIGTTPANFEVTGKTLQDFFKPDTDESALVKTLNQRESAANAAAKSNEGVKSDDVRKADSEKNADEKRAAVTGQGEGNAYSVKSYVSAYNTWQKALVDLKYQTDYNEILVEFDKLILEANNSKGGIIVQPQVQSSRQVAEKNPKDANAQRDAIRSNAGKATAQPDFTVGKWPVNAGTQVTELINLMMQNSDYIRSQMVDPTIGAEQNAEKLKKDLSWWKIVPSIQLKKYDIKNAKWNYRVTFHVIPYTVYNRVHPNAAKSLPTGWHKEYQYIYTGQNHDIIDFQLNFDSMFYTKVTINRGKTQAAAGPQNSQNQEDNLKQDTKVNNYNTTVNVGPNPPQIQNVEGQLGASSTGNQNRDSVAQSVASVQESVYADAKGDMLSVQLRVIGDPQFIKQDDLYYTPANKRFNQRRYSDTYLDAERINIGTDGGEVHAYVRFRTPVDMNDSTGLADFKEDTMNTAFSGIYRVLSVSNQFAGGKFEQTLEMIRLQDQPQDPRYNPAAVQKQNNTNRNDKVPTLQGQNGEEFFEFPLDSTVSDANGNLSQGNSVEDMKRGIFGRTYDTDQDADNDYNRDDTDDTNGEEDPNADELADVAGDNKIENRDIDDAKNQDNENPVKSSGDTPPDATADKQKQREAAAAKVAELDAKWEAQYLVVKQKNDERIANLKAVAASPAYQNGTEAQKAELSRTGSVEAARLAFNEENQKLTAIKKEFDAAKAAEAALK